MDQKSQGNFYIVIMAGGSGTRLWPLSRKAKPKQFQSFVSSQTLIQETFERARQVVPVENIYVSTTHSCSSLVLEQIPEISQERLIIEPQSRNTAPAIALIASSLYAMNAEAVVATIASDHAIENEEEFTSTLRAALMTAYENKGKLVTVGINPTRADTGLGYIKMGKEFTTIEEKRSFFVDAFKEKPDKKTAEKYLASWDYLWNAGYFIFCAETFVTWTKKFAPEIAECLEKIIAEKNNGTLTDEKFEELYALTPKEAVEPTIVEKLSSEDLLVIPSPLKWSDVGSWGTLYEFLGKKLGSSSVITHNNHTDLNSKNIFVHGTKNRLITTLGLEDIVIIDTEDALLVARRDEASTEIKNLIKKLEDENKGAIL